MSNIRIKQGVKDAVRNTALGAGAGMVIGSQVNPAAMSSWGLTLANAGIGAVGGAIGSRRSHFNDAHDNAKQ